MQSVAYLRSLAQRSSETARDLDWSSTFLMVGNHWQQQPVSCKLIGCSVWYMHVFCLSFSIDDDDASDSDDESVVQASREGGLFDETASSGSESDSEGESRIDGNVGEPKPVKVKSGSHSDLFASSAASDSGASDSETEGGGKANGETENGKEEAVSCIFAKEEHIPMCSLIWVYIRTYIRTYVATVDLKK